MSDPELLYPNPVYRGSDGLVNATIRPAGHEPEVRYRSGGTAHYLATHASTRGQFGLHRWEIVPRQGGPAAHFHRSISESFYVLSGTVRLYDGRSWSWGGRAGEHRPAPDRATGYRAEPAGRSRITCSMNVP